MNVLTYPDADAPMFYVGSDVPSERISPCVLSEAGGVARRPQGRSLDGVLRTLRGLPDRLGACHEASCGYGHSHGVPRPLAAWALVARRGRS